jgi:hypothetical protein
MAVPGERSDRPGGSAAEQTNSPLPLIASNSDILAWLDVLLKGKPEQQALARTEIAMILEARGHTEDAEEHSPPGLPDRFLTGSLPGMVRCSL